MTHKDDSSKGYKEELRWVRKLEGSTRPKSRQTSGYERDLLRDENGGLLGPTESRPVTKEDRHLLEAEFQTNRATSWQTLLVTEIFVPIASQAIERLVIPLGVQAWENHRGKRRQKSQAKRLKKKKINVANESKQLATTSESLPMDAEEYAARLALAELAEEFAKKQRQLLSQHSPVGNDIKVIEAQVRELVSNEEIDVQASLLQGLTFLTTGNPQKRFVNEK